MRCKRIGIIVLAIILMCIGTGGTLAWLSDSSGPVKNTFTVGNIDITLGETTTSYKMVPGNTIAKDPKITVKGGSEACWLFVKIEESVPSALSSTYAFDDFISYTLTAGWKPLDNVSGVYYMEIPAGESDQPFYVLKDNQVTVPDTVTKEMMDALEQAEEMPELTFTAYAIQKDNITSAADAWAKLNPGP